MSKSGTHIADCYGSNARRSYQAQKDAAEIARPVILQTGGVLALRSIKDRIERRGIAIKDDLELIARQARKFARRHRGRRFRTMLGRLP